MLTSDLLRNRQAPTEQALFDQLQGRQSAGTGLPQPPQFPLQSLRCGSAQGRLMGGNLAMIGSTLGTPWEIDTQDAILFIEDVGEPPYKIDRLLTQLRLAGKLQGLRGVLIGDFSDVSVKDSSPEQQAWDSARVQRLWQAFFVPLNVPVMAGWRSGHVDPNLTLPIYWCRGDPGRRPSRRARGAGLGALSQHADHPLGQEVRWLQHKSTAPRCENTVFLTNNPATGQKDGKNRTLQSDCSRCSDRSTGS